MSGRFGATIEQVKNDLTEGIDGKDFITDVGRGIRNTMVGTWHVLNGVIPSIANAFGGQDYEVVRRTGPVQGTTNAVRKVFQTRGIIGKASAVLVEALDGPVDDAFNAFGAGKWIIQPTRSRAAHAIAW